MIPQGACRVVPAPRRHGRMDSDMSGEDAEYRIEKLTELSASLAMDLRARLESAFEGDFSDADWAHALGGTHAVVRRGGAIVAHASIVPRAIWVDDRRFRAGYVEAVAVIPELQGRGIGTVAMRALDVDLEEYDIGVLSTGSQHFYERLGWESWAGPTWVRTGAETRRSADEDGNIMIKRTARSGAISLSSSIACEARFGDDW